jgi:hypothetical protein
MKSKPIISSLGRGLQGGGLPTRFSRIAMRRSPSSIVATRRGDTGSTPIPTCGSIKPSAFYGVSSVPFGHDALDEVGTNAGYYDTAGRGQWRIS